MSTLPDTTIGDARTSGAYQIFRGIFEARQANANSDTRLSESGDGYAKGENSGASILLSHFTDKFRATDCLGQKESSLSAKNVKQFFWQKWGWFVDNIFESNEGQAVLKDGNVTQQAIFDSVVTAHGGVQYSLEDENKIKSALNFAKADIEAIEKSRAGLSYDTYDGRNNGVLDFADVMSYTGWKDSHLTEMGILDLDGDARTMSPEEYACYLLVADGLASIDEKTGEVILKEQNEVDGTITAEEAGKIASADDKDLQIMAKAIYDKYFNN